MTIEDYPCPVCRAMPGEACRGLLFTGSRWHASRDVVRRLAHAFMVETTTPHHDCASCVTLQSQLDAAYRRIEAQRHTIQARTDERDEALRLVAETRKRWTYHHPIERTTVVLEEDSNE